MLAGPAAPAGVERRPWSDEAGFMGRSRTAVVSAPSFSFWPPANRDALHIVPPGVLFSFQVSHILRSASDSPVRRSLFPRSGMAAPGGIETD